MPRHTITSRLHPLPLGLLLTLLASPGYAAPPAEFDWSNYGGLDLLGPVSNQQSCGADWAMASLDAMAAVWNIQAGTPGASPIFSAQELVSCLNGGAGNGCTGAFPGTAMAYLQDTGVVSSSCFVYAAQDLACPDFATCPDSALQPGRTLITGYSQQMSPSEQDMMQAILDYGPVVVTMSVYDDFYAYAGGVYQHMTGSLLGSHAVTLYGWGTEGATPYWAARNTWGDAWGNNGNFRIRRGVNEVDIEEWMWSIDGIASCTCSDTDLDGYVDPGCVDVACGLEDCVPTDPAIYPSATEVCDGMDNNCDGSTDEGVLNACGECGAVPAEVCDGVDNDCDGTVDGLGLCESGHSCIGGTCQQDSSTDGGGTTDDTTTDTGGCLQQAPTPLLVPWVLGLWATLRAGRRRLATKRAR